MQELFKIVENEAVNGLGRRVEQQSFFLLM